MNDWPVRERKCKGWYTCYSVAYVRQDWRPAALYDLRSGSWLAWAIIPWTNYLLIRQVRCTIDQELEYACRRARQTLRVHSLGSSTSVWNDVMSAILKVLRHIEARLRSISVHLLEEQLRQISSRSDLKIRSLRLFGSGWRAVATARRRTR